MYVLLELYFSEYTHTVRSIGQLQSHIVAHSVYIISNCAHTLLGPDIVLYRGSVHLCCRTCPLELYTLWYWPGHYFCEPITEEL